MNRLVADVAPYAAALQAGIAGEDVSGLDIFVLPPFTTLHAAARLFSGSPVAIGGQNMHWERSGAWTGEISADMLKEAGCTYVELAHAERLVHFGETYDAVRRKVRAALDAGLQPIICLGESGDDLKAGAAETVLADQMATSLADVEAHELGAVVLAYEPRWAIGAAEAASPAYVAARHAGIRNALVARYGGDAGGASRIIYGGSVDADNAPAIAALPEVDGLFVGRHAWNGFGFADIVRIVADAAKEGMQS